MMPLSYAAPDNSYVVKKIGGNHDVKKHLESLGFHVGSEVSVVTVLDDNLVVKVKETRVALSGELARRIMI